MEASEEDERNVPHVTDDFPGTRKEDSESVSDSVMSDCDPVDGSLPGSSVHGILQARIQEWGCHFLLQGIFPTQESNPGLPHCRQILYHLSHQGRPRERGGMEKGLTKGGSRSGRS